MAITFAGFGSAVAGGNGTGIPYPSGTGANSLLMACVGNYSNANGTFQDSTTALAGFTIAQTKHPGIQSTLAPNYRAISFRRRSTAAESGSAAYTGPSVTMAGLMAHFTCGVGEEFSTKVFTGWDGDPMGTTASILGDIAVQSLKAGDLILIQVVFKSPLPSITIVPPPGLSLSAPSWVAAPPASTFYTYATVVTVLADWTATGHGLDITNGGVAVPTDASQGSYIATRIRKADFVLGSDLHNGTKWRTDAEVYNGTSWRQDAEIYNGTSWKRLHDYNTVEPKPPIAWIVYPASNDKPPVGALMTYSVRPDIIDPDCTYSWSTSGNSTPRTGTGTTFQTTWSGQYSGPSLTLVATKGSDTSRETNQMFIQ